jgi:hypothetical protein
MPENPRLLSLGMNGILSERSGGLKPRALARGVVHFWNRKLLKAVGQVFKSMEDREAIKS